jgi:putative endonuclease
MIGPLVKPEAPAEWVPACAGMTVFFLLSAKQIIRDLRAANQKTASTFHNPDMKPCVYILASRRNGSLYIGVTTDIRRRLSEHHDGTVAHTARYGVRRLVYFEDHQKIADALVREKRLKAWKRDWKIRLIEEINPDWNDLRQALAWRD